MFTHLHQIGPFSEQHARIYAAEVTLALEHLHSVSPIGSWDKDTWITPPSVHSPSLPAGNSVPRYQTGEHPPR